MLCHRWGGAVLTSTLQQEDELYILGKQHCIYKHWTQLGHSATQWGEGWVGGMDGRRKGKVDVKNLGGVIKNEHVGVVG